MRKKNTVYKVEEEEWGRNKSQSDLKVTSAVMYHFLSLGSASVVRGRMRQGKVSCRCSFRTVRGGVFFYVSTGRVRGAAAWDCHLQEFLVVALCRSKRTRGSANPAHPPLGVCNMRYVLHVPASSRHSHMYVIQDLNSTVQDHDGNTARCARTSDNAQRVCVLVAPIAPTLLDLGRAAYLFVELACFSTSHLVSAPSCTRRGAVTTYILEPHTIETHKPEHSNENQFYFPRNRHCSQGFPDFCDSIWKSPASVVRAGKLRRDVQGVLTSGLCVLCGLVRETSSARREIQLLQPYGWYKGPSTPPALSFGNDERGSSWELPLSAMKNEQQRDNRKTFLLNPKNKRLWSEISCLGRMIHLSRAVSGKIDKLLTAPSTSHADKVKNAELLMTAFITVHNIPFSIYSHLSNIVLQMCPDSVIAKDIACSHLCAKLKVNNFSILVDEASDNVGRKQLCVVRTVNTDFKVHEDFFSLTELGSATADVLFDDEGGIELKDNLLGMAGDGANLIMGANNPLSCRLE
ncbi:hypothetical protein PR048_014156 [Dryococelus australis]|uniref:Uncharacterized protein n=1 Tax=Dryococelus australis TaxID=614101 RepID=A0ABQ9HDL7_9NEOP|nr:hypothetical protein PR048_014156 [Dryococelus australis]